MDFGILLTLLAILGLLVCSAFFSGSETAMTAISRARLHALAKNGDKRAGLVQDLTHKIDRLIGAILIGNNLVNILASALATSIFLSIFGQTGVFYATIVMTVLVVIFSEVLPKTYAIYEPDRTALFFAPILKPIVTIFAPVGAVVQVIVRMILRALGADIDSNDNMLSAHDELRGAIDLHHKEGGCCEA